MLVPHRLRFIFFRLLSDLCLCFLTRWPCSTSLGLKTVVLPERNHVGRLEGTHGHVKRDKGASTRLCFLVLV